MNQRYPSRVCGLAIFVILSVFTLGLWAADNQLTVPKELLEYVRDARHLGLKDAQIQQNAIKAGWDAATVQAAISSTFKITPEKPLEAAKPQDVTACCSSHEAGWGKNF